VKRSRRRLAPRLTRRLKEEENQVVYGSKAYMATRKVQTITS
jgi:hypothetical protein